MDEVYDLVVIGAGPAGEVAAELAAAFGRRVLVVERDKPGGVIARRRSMACEPSCAERGPADPPRPSRARA